jgi:SAM-dependent methyltransferase
MSTMRDFAYREAQNAWNMYIANAAERWDEIYARGFGEMLDGSGQRARHYVIAGIVADACGPAPAVLDVGCGFGTTYELLRLRSPCYVGIDLSRRAIERCREHFGGDRGASFEVAAFERYEPGRTFDAVILNEVLQYFPLRRRREVVERAIAHLAGPHGVLVVSLSGLGKSLALWAGLRWLPRPSQRISIQSRPVALLGGRWVVKAYTDLA